MRHVAVTLFNAIFFVILTVYSHLIYSSITDRSEPCVCTLAPPTIDPDRTIYQYNSQRTPYEILLNKGF